MVIPFFGKLGWIVRTRGVTVVFFLCSFLVDNDLGTEGAEIIFDSLKTNKSLTLLDLASTPFFFILYVTLFQ
jgi:hypothetical protein